MNLLFCQDLGWYEQISIATVGLTYAPFDKAGLAIADIDGNGWQDIFCLRENVDSYSRIYLNEYGLFRDITGQSLFRQFEQGFEKAENQSVILVDYDNDGDKDISMSGGSALYLLRNDNNRFTDVSQKMKFIGKKPEGIIADWIYNVGGWADYDLDGDLDCVVSQENNPNLYLFRNDGVCFTDVAAEAGLDSCPLAEYQYVSWTDIDVDGDPDLFGGNVFMDNANGYFRDVTDSIGFGELEEATFSEFFDYDNDGDLDFLKLPGPPGGSDAVELWENRNGFYELTELILFIPEYGSYSGLSTGDFENDGDLDIFLPLNESNLPDILMYNDEIIAGERVFHDVAEFIGIASQGDQKGGGFFDYDNDGYLDIYCTSTEFSHFLYHNLALSMGNWVGFILEGTRSNRDAMGSLVTLYYTGERRQIRYTSCGNDFINQDNPWVHFGIGFELSVDSVVVRWPLGYKQVLTDVEINRYHKIKEPELTTVDAISNELLPCDFKLEQNYPNPFNPATEIVYYLPNRQHVRLEVFSTLGQHVATLVDGEQSAGEHKIHFNAGYLAAGVYFYRLTTDAFSQLKKMIYLK
ncbi:VCBS repeat-containing protein [candidate division KSB1 bacterium]|nr:VCBS repeat-containing protein [candidate division KSB1 bacterium]